MNKKGILMTYVLIFTIISVSVSFALFFNIEGKKYNFQIGKVQGEVIKSFNEVNSKKYYLNSNFIDITNNSINKILKNAGIQNPTYKDNYILWKKGKVECFPKEINELILILSQEIKNDLGENLTININQLNNSLEFNINTPIISTLKDENYNVEYSEKLNEKYIINNFDFKEFISKVNEIEKISKKCNDNNLCWKEELSKKNDIKLTENLDKLFKLEFSTPGIEDTILVKIAIDYEEELNIGEKELKC